MLILNFSKIKVFLQFFHLPSKWSIVKFSELFQKSRINEGRTWGNAFEQSRPGNREISDHGSEAMRERERERDLFKNCPVLIELIMAGQMVKTRRERHRQRLETSRDVCNGKQVLRQTASSTDPSVKLRQFCTTQGSFTTTVAPSSLVSTKRWSGVASGDQQQPQRRRRGASLGFVTL